MIQFMNFLCSVWNTQQQQLFPCMLHCVVHVQINTSVHTAEYEHVTCLIARSADIKELPQPAILVSFFQFMNSSLKWQ